MSEWRDVALRELCDSVQYGVTASALPDRRTGTRFLRITDIVPPSIDWDSVPDCDVPAEVAERFRVRSGDIVVARTGATVGYAKHLRDPPPAVFASYLVRFQIGQGADPAYVGHVIQSDAYKQYVRANAGGAAQPNANAKTLGAFRVPLPDLKTQRRIAAVLSAFDELIEINERRIELLENLARSLYREWFVRYRFPGHVDAESVDSELGLIPERWEVRIVGDVLDVIGGGTPSKKRSEYWLDGHIPWFTPTDLTRSRRRFVDESEHPITALGLASSSARLFPPGSVLMTSRATLGVLAIASKEATCNQGFIVIPPVDGVPPAFIYEWLASQSAELEQIATGATFKEITKGAFKRFPLIWPPRELLAKFTDAVSPWLRRIEECEWHNRELAATHDLLLPRLVTGRLDISEVDLGALLQAEPA